MKYGLELSNAGACGDARTLAELAALAEAARWDGIFLEDYIVHWSGQNAPTYDPWVALTAMALRTERIRLGTTVTPLARRRPWKLARETVTLDHLSNGRLILGVGLGNGSDLDFAQLGEETEDRRRAKMLDEAIDVLVGLWSGEPFSYHGEHFQVRDVTLLPPAVQIPRIPIWVGGGWPRKGPMRRAARCDGAIFFKVPEQADWMDMTPADVRALKAFVEEQRSVNLPFDIAIGGRERREDWDAERAFIQSIADAGATWWMEGLPPAELNLTRAWIQRGPLRID
jgi:alkanesulfonate monooxygenase SsuD/methylene tetrahydromethanopterin reductase-like flavin-dependent oxidoreductase (luciferase family)